MGAAQRPELAHTADGGPPAALQPTNVRRLVFALACATSFVLYLHRYVWGFIKTAVADEFDLRRLVRFGHEVVAAEYDEVTARWTVNVRDGEGRTVVLDADAVISATGQLNRPKLPDVPGRETFAGP